MQTPDNPPRPIRSYVRREGRLTPAQQRALIELLPRYAADPADASANTPLDLKAPLISMSSANAGEGVGGLNPADAPASTPLDPRQVFGNNNPVIMEIGFGNGELLSDQAAAHPQYNFLGVETHRPGVGRLLNQLHERGIDNVRVVVQDAIEVLARLPRHCLHSLWLFFPDPWPKKKHHKRRIVNHAFTQTAAERLAPEGVLHFATDWQDYARQIQETMTDSARFRPLTSNETRQYPFRRPPTKFERRGAALGHDIVDLYYRADSDNGASR